MSDGQLSFRKSANIDRVTDKRKDSLFRLVDTDGSGTIDAQEFAVLYDAIKKDLAEELEKEAALAKEASSAKRRFKMLLLFVAVLVSFLAASVAANFAVIFTVVDQAITTTTTSTGLLEVKGSDVIAKTAAATQDVPLIVAPALDLDTLANAKSLKVSYRENDYDDDVVEAQYSIVAVRKHNTTYVEFITDVDGEVIEVINGGAYLSRSPTAVNGAKTEQFHEICSANATCSAFRASGIDVDAALELAKEQLSAAGFEEQARRLAPASGWCYGGAWMSTISCGYENTGSAFTFQGSCLGGALDTNPSPPSSSPSVVAASMMAHYWSGWGPMKHIVFFAVGKDMAYYEMWWKYCSTTQYQSCTALDLPAFKHLVFVFANGGITDAASEFWSGTMGWTTNVDDSSLYSVPANALSSGLATQISSGVSALTKSYRCVRKCVYRRTGLSGYGLSGLSTTYVSRPYCYYTCSWQYPFNSRTEVMVIGFSDGGGLAMYMNYHSPLVTKSVSIDYWAYGAYESWLTTPATGASVNAKIYTACNSELFEYGVAGLLPDSDPVGNTYPSGASLTADAPPTLLSEFGVGPSGAVGKWWSFAWGSTSTGESITVHIHKYANAPTSFPTTAMDSYLTTCGSAITGTPLEVHGKVMDWVEPALEITEWITVRRRLDAEAEDDETNERELWSVHTYKLSDAQESFISSKSVSDASFGNFRTPKIRSVGGSVTKYAVKKP